MHKRTAKRLYEERRQVANKLNFTVGEREREIDREGDLSSKQNVNHHKWLQNNYLDLAGVARVFWPSAHQQVCP